MHNIRGMRVHNILVVGYAGNCRIQSCVVYLSESMFLGRSQENNNTVFKF